jgi:membrane-associated phospholipid phosphatase
LSRVIARQRPPTDAWLAEPEGFSLPSKHTTLAVLAVGAAVRVLGIPAAPAQAAPLVAAAGIGVSRVYLGVHWPADVLAGWLFAEGWLRLTDSG